MKKMMFILVAVTFIAFGCNAGAYAQMNKSMGKGSKDVDSWIGKAVRNRQGENLGKVIDVVRNDRGEVYLVITFHGGFFGISDRKVAVPFNDLSFNEREDHAVLDVTREQMAIAPAIENTEDLNDPAFVASVHGYFDDPGLPAEGATTHGHQGSSEDRQ